MINCFLSYLSCHKPFSLFVTRGADFFGRHNAVLCFPVLFKNNFPYLKSLKSNVTYNQNWISSKQYSGMRCDSSCSPVSCRKLRRAN